LPPRVCLPVGSFGFDRIGKSVNGSFDFFEIFQCVRSCESFPVLSYSLYVSQKDLGRWGLPWSSTLMLSFSRENHKLKACRRSPVTCPNLTGPPRFNHPTRLNNYPFGCFPHQRLKIRVGLRHYIRVGPHFTPHPQGVFCGPRTGYLPTPLSVISTVDRLPLHNTLWCLLSHFDYLFFPFLEHPIQPVTPVPKVN